VLTHDPPHTAPPAPPQTHVPVWQLEPGGHLLPQVPQLLESFARSRHCEPHCVSEPGQLHLPLLHELPRGHWLPQPLQFRKSLVVSTQVWLHIICDPGHAHAPLLQLPLGHTFPQVPQLFGSVIGSEHCALHMCAHTVGCAAPSRAPSVTPPSMFVVLVDPSPTDASNSPELELPGS
jgi:hypothetical protein